MAAEEILSSYIKKLNHPLQEIRERALKLLTAKLRLGWQLEDELSATRQLLEALLAWFQVHKPTLQKEALELLLTILKTKAGTYISREFGIREILSSLNRVKDKIDSNAIELFDDVTDTLRFLNTVQSDDDLAVPRLTLPSVTSSESGGGSSGGFYNLGSKFQSSKETSISNEEVETSIGDVTTGDKQDGVRILLFPWVELCSSDSKTIILIEDALKLLKSTRRCCRFIRDVFLRDFPAEIFLNRPIIIKSLLTITEGANGGRPAEALQVLLFITRALRKRILELSSIELIHETNKVPFETKESDDGVNLALEHIASDDGMLDQPRQEDGLAALRQLPAPVYALDTLHSVLSTMARSIVLDDPNDKQAVLDMKELNICVNLVECLIQLLLDCITESFWTADHVSKTHRDISHKSCMVMRILGDLLMKYSKRFNDDPEKIQYRATWLRLVACAERLLCWSCDSALPPSSLVAALQSAQLDPGLQLMYPEISRGVAAVLQSAKSSVDQEYKSKYRELMKLYDSMEDAVHFMKNKNGCKHSKGVLIRIKKSLPVLELHLSENYLNDVCNIILFKLKDYALSDDEWSTARNIALSLMSHSIEWVCSKFYSMMADMVKTVLIGDETNQSENEKCLTLLFDVGILTEICCHGLSSKCKQVENSSSEIVLYLLRGRLVLSESCWWRLLASLLPVLPLLHVYAAHDTPLGQAIWKSLERDIAECMGVPATEVTWGLIRMMFVQCVAIQLEAAHSLCRSLDDDRYLPPQESLRADVLLNALRRIEPQDFNVDFSSSPSKSTQTTGLLQILDVLKQDIVLDENGTEMIGRCSVQPALEPSLRRSTLQQLAVMMRQQEFHDSFLQSDGLKVIVAILRMSLMVDDYLAFPECAISCVSILNSVCFVSRHSLAKIHDLPALLTRVILVFPANESAVLLSAQVLALVAWSGFVLQELDSSRRRVPALPFSVTQRTSLPFNHSSYWHTSPNAEHSTVEWLLSSEEWRAAVRVRWWCSYVGRSACERASGADVPIAPAPLSLRVSPRDVTALKAASALRAAASALTALENATSHAQVFDALNVLESYVHLLPLSSVNAEDFAALPWQHTRRFLAAPPASSRDTALLIALMQFLLAYMSNVPDDGVSISWIKSYFIGDDSVVISLLSRDQLHPHQTPQDNIEVTQLHIHIVKIVLRCVVSLEIDNSYDSNRMESLLKILLACLEKIDLKNFHMLGYLNELMRCIRYVLNSRYCKLSEDTLLQCLKLTTRTLSGCASGGGRKGQACRLDALLSLLALLRQIHDEQVNVQRWYECWESEVVRAVSTCSRGASPQLRAAALHVITALAHHAQLLPQLLQAIPEESLSQLACRVFARRHEANVARCGAARLLATLAARTSSHCDVLEQDILGQMKENNFIENCLDILIDFCNDKEYKSSIEPNVPLSILERRSELEVRAQKCSDTQVSPSVVTFGRRPPPTAGLVASVADVVHNISAFSRCPVQNWNDQGLFRLLFRCASWSSGSPREVSEVRAAASRALAACATHKCVRTMLAATKDCLYSLLATLTPLDDDEWHIEYLNARTQALLLLASVLTERSASDGLWRELRDRYSVPFFNLLLQSLESKENEYQAAGLHCLSQLALSTTHKRHPDKTKDNSWVEFYDNIKSSYANERVSNRCGAGDSGTDDCQPEYMAEEICKALLLLYQKTPLDMKKYQTHPEEQWPLICSCLCSVWSVSARSRQYGVHRGAPQILSAALHAIRDVLSMHGKPAEVIKNANHNPVLRTLNWLLTLINCLMVNCRPAKEAFAEENISVSLVRLWPWCMMTDQLRNSVMHLLFTFSNDCPKAWSSMSTCVGGRTVTSEVCALCCREAALQSRPRSHTLLLLCINTLRRCVLHHQCRTIILKSDVVSSLYKLAIRERARGGACSASSAAWGRLCEALARHSDGAGALLALRPQLAALSASLRALLVPALAHAAAHHRLTFLQCPDLLELLSGTLLAGDTAEMVSAARAVWSLAANSHKAKLQLRSAGVAAAVHSALQRLQRSHSDPETQRAFQLLTYTNTVLQTS